eukprot:COSAG01_NODE_7473_length_3196_cov_2.514046_4_plen_196_part_01
MSIRIGIAKRIGKSQSIQSSEHDHVDGRWYGPPLCGCWPTAPACSLAPRDAKPRTPQRSSPLQYPDTSQPARPPSQRQCPTSQPVSPEKLSQCPTIVSQPSLLVVSGAGTQAWSAPPSRPSRVPHGPSSFPLGGPPAPSAAEAALVDRAGSLGTAAGRGLSLTRFGPLSMWTCHVTSLRIPVLKNVGKSQSIQDLG